MMCEGELSLKRNNLVTEEIMFIHIDFAWHWVTIQRLRSWTKRDVIVWLAISPSHCDKLWNAFTCEWIYGSSFKRNKNVCFAGDRVGEQFSTTLILCVIEVRKSKDLPRIVLNFETSSLGSPQGQNKQERRSSSMKWKPVTATSPLSPQSCMQDFREASVMQGVILFKNDWAEKCWYKGIKCRECKEAYLVILCGICLQFRN